MPRSIYAEKQDMELEAKKNSAAALMVLLGEDLASQIMSHLDPKEVQQLSAAIEQVNGQESEYVDQLDQLLDMHDFPRTSPSVS